MHGLSQLVRGVAAVLVFGAVVAQQSAAHDSGTPPAATPTAAECVAAQVEGTPAATPASPPATPGPEAAVSLVDVASLTAALEMRGVEVEDTGAIDQSLFNAAEVRRLLIRGGALAGEAEVQVYIYDDVETLAADAGQVTPDGNLMTVMIEWIATPHFYCGDQILVIYIGDDQAAIDLLTELLGPRFAGG
jgi:hypothetical protein